MAKLSELEQAMATLAHAQARTEANLDRLEAGLAESRANYDRQAAQTSANLDRLEAGVAESRANYDRQAAQTSANLDRLSEELRAGFEQSRLNLDRLDQRIDEANRRAGEALNRVGRLVEDVVAPTLQELFEKLFPADGPAESAIRIRRGKDRREFDAYAAGEEHFLLMSAKGTVAAGDVTELLATLATIRDYFPEAAKKKVHGALGSLYADRSVVTLAERRGLFVIGLRPGITTVLNSEGFEPAAF